MDEYVLPEFDIYYFPKERLFTDCDGFEIFNIYQYLEPSDVRILLHDKCDQQFVNYGMILNVFYFNESQK